MLIGHNMNLVILLVILCITNLVLASPVSNQIAQVSLTSKATSASTKEVLDKLKQEITGSNAPMMRHATLSTLGIPATIPGSCNDEGTKDIVLAYFHVEGKAVIHGLWSLKTPFKYYKVNKDLIKEATKKSLNTKSLNTKLSAWEESWLRALWFGRQDKKIWRHELSKHSKDFTSLSRNCYVHALNSKKLLEDKIKLTKDALTSVAPKGDNEEEFNTQNEIAIKKIENISLQHSEIRAIFTDYIKAVKNLFFINEKLRLGNIVADMGFVAGKPISHEDLTRELKKLKFSNIKLIGKAVKENRCVITEIREYYKVITHGPIFQNGLDKEKLLLEAIQNRKLSKKKVSPVGKLKLGDRCTPSQKIESIYFCFPNSKGRCLWPMITEAGTTGAKNMEGTKSGRIAQVAHRQLG